MAGGRGAVSPRLDYQTRDFHRYRSAPAAKLYLKKVEVSIQLYHEILIYSIDIYYEISIIIMYEANYTTSAHQ